LTLSSCAYYGDIHSHSNALTPTALNTHHSYRLPPKTGPAEWWDRFHDSQLNQLITVALADSPNMEIAKNRVNRAQYLADNAASHLWPSVDASGYAQRQKFAEFGLIPPPFNGHTYNIGDIGLNFNYEFDFWGKNRQLLAARVSEQCAAQADQAEAQLIISAAVANTYFELLGNIEHLKIAKAILQHSREMSAIIVKRNKHQIESDIPTKTSLVDVDSAKISVDQYQQAEKLSRHQLAVLLGKNPFETTVSTSSFHYHHYPVKLPTSLPAHLLAQRPDIFAAKSRAEAAAHQANVAKALFFPDINLNALLSYQSVDFGRLFHVSSQNNAITGAFDLPIFDASARRSNLGVHYAEYDLAVNTYNQTILTALREVADQLSILKMIQSQLTAQQEAVKALQVNYKLFNLRYNHGIIDYISVLQIKEKLLQQQATQINFQIRHLQAVVGMLKALGGAQG
jgi:NodT family efflux transporter outer membrane factor (OMF) lipoprotein